MENIISINAYSCRVISTWPCQLWPFCIDRQFSVCTLGPPDWSLGGMCIGRAHVTLALLKPLLRDVVYVPIRRVHLTQGSAGSAWKKLYRIEGSGLAKDEKCAILRALPLTAASIADGWYACGSCHHRRGLWDLCWVYSGLRWWWLGCKSCNHLYLSYFNMLSVFLGGLDCVNQSLVLNIPSFPLIFDRVEVHAATMASQIIKWASFFSASPFQPIA